MEYTLPDYNTLVGVVFKYGNYLAFSNTECLKYKQECREGEKAGKVRLLRDIQIKKTIFRTRGYEQYINRVRFINKNALFNSADMALIETKDGKN